MRITLGDRNLGAGQDLTLVLLQTIAIRKQTVLDRSRLKQRVKDGKSALVRNMI